MTKNNILNNKANSINTSSAKKYLKSVGDGIATFGKAGQLLNGLRADSSAERGQAIAEIVAMMCAG